jgi:hypothetical protein
MLDWVEPGVLDFGRLLNSFGLVVIHDSRSSQCKEPLSSGMDTARVVRRWPAGSQWRTSRQYRPSR